MFLRLPEVSSRQGEAIITEWFAALNDPVKKGQDILEVSSDKATFDVQAPCDGILINVLKNKGERVPVGEIIAEISETDS